MTAKTYRPRCMVTLDVLLQDVGVASYKVIPRSASVVRNGLRVADTVSVELDYLDLSFDPRAIRDCKIDVFMGDVANPAEPALPQSDAYRIFTGYLDQPEASLSAAGELVRLKGRDFTSLLLDKEWTDGSIRIDRPLPMIVDEIVSGTPAAEVSVEWDSSNVDVVISKLVGRTRFSPKQNDDRWTVLSEICGLVGLAPTFDLDVLKIVSPDLVAASSTSGTTAAFLYGGNVSELTYTRKLNSTAQHQVQVICWNETTRSTRTSVFPKTPIVLRQRRPTKGGKTVTDDAPIKTFHVRGSYTQADLDSRTERLFKESALSELEGRLETRDLADLHDVVDLDEAPVRRRADGHAGHDADDRDRWNDGERSAGLPRRRRHVGSAPPPRGRSSRPRVPRRTRNECSS